MNRTHAARIAVEGSANYTFKKVLTCRLIWLASFRPISGLEAPRPCFDIELVHEKASSLGRFGRNLEGAPHALFDFDATHSRCPAPSPEDLHLRSALVAEAGRVLWHFIVQREACGLHDSRPVREDYQMPAEVQGEMGAMREPRLCAID